MPLHLVLPLVGAVVYVVAALLLKRAANLGADVWRTTRIINYTAAAASIPLWLFGGTIPSASSWWQPALGGLLFLSGQLLTLLALNIGDVSVATPVLGVKILLVALLTAVLIGDPIGARLWTAAALSSVAIALLNFNREHTHGRVGTTIILAGLGASAYALFDVLVQKWSPVWGTGRFCRSRWAAERYIHWRSAHMARSKRRRTRTRQSATGGGSSGVRRASRCRG